MLKWSSTGLIVLLLIVWLASLQYSAWLLIKPVGQIGIWPGQILLAWPDDWSMVPRIVDGGISRLQAVHHEWWFRHKATGPAKVLALPIWCLLLLIVPPTLLLWWRDRKHGPNLCPKCGYSRIGLAADRACPECGNRNERHAA